MNFSLLGYLAVGASGMLVNTGILAFVAEVVGVHYLVAAVVATQGSTLWNFVGHQGLIFAGRPTQRSLPGRLSRYFLVNNLALLPRAPILAALVGWLGMPYLEANLATLIGLALVRFALADRWIWPRPPTEQPSQAGHMYDIHEILAIRSAFALPELEYFRVLSLERTADIEVHPGPAPMDSRRPDVAHYHDGFGRLGFQVSLARSQGIQAWVSPLVARSPHVLYTNVVEPVLRWSFVERGYALVHAAAIAFNGRAALITAPTDTGKTTTVLRALDSQSWTFLADDMTVLSPDGTLLSFPKPLTISAHTLVALPTSSLDLGERLALAVQSRLHSRSGRRFGLRLAAHGLPAATLNALVQWLIPPPKYPVSRLIPEVQMARQGRAELVVVLAKGPDREEPLAPPDLLRILRENSEDAYGFPPYRSLEGFLSRKEDVDYRAAEAEIVRRGLQKTKGIRLSRQQYRWWKSLPSLLRPGDLAAADTIPTSRGYSRER